MTTKTTTPTHQNLADDPEVAALVQRAALAHGALMRGDLAGYQRQIETRDDFVLMSPFGGQPTQGAPYSAEQWQAIARFFGNGRESTLELVRAWRSESLIVLAAIERTVAEVGGLPAQSWALRVTLVFQRNRDRGRWQLAHRHADPLAEGVSLQQAAALAAGPHTTAA